MKCFEKEHTFDTMQGIQVTNTTIDRQINISSYELHYIAAVICSKSLVELLNDNHDWIQCCTTQEENYKNITYKSDVIVTKILLGDITNERENFGVVELTGFVHS